MIQFIEFHKNGTLKTMGVKAKEKAERLFLIENNIHIYEKIINESL
jgi:hypothetical protein